LALDSVSASVDSLQLEAYNVYYALTRRASHLSVDTRGTEPNLGGSLFYIGELDTYGSAMVIAGNVAGCATLSASADLAAQKQAIREGTVDFAVTSLDEALRILKNEIRRRATVAVCVGLAPSDVETEMLERGVLPDLVFARRWDKQICAPNFGIGSPEIQPVDPDPNQAFLEWRVARAPLRWAPKLDAIALECLRSDLSAHRWIRLSPRYCGRSMQGKRVLYCDPDLATQILKQFGAAVQDGSIETQVSVNLMIDGEAKEYRLSPFGTA
jgi:urocanate hydratase